MVVRIVLLCCGFWLSNPVQLLWNITCKRRARRCRLWCQTTSLACCDTWKCRHHQSQAALRPPHWKLLEACTVFPSCSTALSRKRRLFFYVPAEEEAVFRYQEGHRFNTIKGIRKLHSVITSPQQLKVHIRQSSCYCGECLYENYPDCKKKEYVDDFREVKRRLPHWIPCVVTATVYHPFFNDSARETA